MSGITSLNPGKKKAVKLGLLLLSTIMIMIGSVLFYERLVYERALSVSGTITGGSTNQAGLNATPATILILAVAAFVVSLSVFGLLREVFRGKLKNRAFVKDSLSTIRVSLPEEIRPSLQIQSKQEEWEEAPEKKESSH